MLNKSIAALLIVSVFTYGCANTTANPVQVAQLGDDGKSCEGITNEMQEMVQAQAVAEADRNKQIAANVALGVAGAFLLVPWFFMDTGNAATVEERAARARYQRLNQMQIDRKCPASTPPSQSASTVPVQLATTPAGSAGAVAPATAVAQPATVAPTHAVPASLPSAPAQAIVSKEAVVPQPTPRVANSKAGQDSWTVERLAEVKACTADPQAVMVAKGPGSETYTVACSDGNALAVRCEFGNCRVLK
jgi:hypothetical protein